jgi:hypothetical protein
MESIHQRIERFIRAGIGDFQTLALDLFKHQFEHNKPYAAFCAAQKRTPDAVHAWQEIPAVPIHAFKVAELCCVPTPQAAAVFHSSTTTGQQPSRHFLADLKFYELSSRKSFQAWVLPDEAALPFLMLVPPPNEAPHSSLTWMLDVVQRTYAAPGSAYFVERGRLQEPRLERRLARCEEEDQPVALLGTTLAWMAFFDYCKVSSRTFQLPKGSRLMDTGGMKTQKRDIPRDVVVRAVQATLGIPEASCINEYGMCELSSQLYGRGSSLDLTPPHWLRTLVIDPSSGLPTMQRPGLLRHYDLANVDSVMAIQTDDLGVAKGDGISFLGRAPESELRGCSLAAEAFTGRPVSRS